MLESTLIYIIIIIITKQQNIFSIIFVNLRIYNFEISCPRTPLNGFHRKVTSCCVMLSKGQKMYLYLQIEFKLIKYLNINFSCIND